mmetsp:Transcript_13062/g.37237  ORF Transcript_13062/g.37237 Transcript_13062/m.37237 type:complete len:362 (+) Transcript_13062:17-1102(+)
MAQAPGAVDSASTAWIYFLCAGTMALEAHRSPPVAFLSSSAVHNPGSVRLHRRPTSDLGDRIGSVQSGAGTTRRLGGRLQGGFLAALVTAGAHLASGRRGRRHVHGRRRGCCLVQRSGFLLSGMLQGKNVPEDEGESGTIEDLHQQWGLHSLTDADLEQLKSGLPVQKQERDGPTGSGLVVVEVDAPPSVVLECLESFERYHEMIPVVRQAELVSRTPMAQGNTLARLNYRISKFWLNLSVVHKIDRTKGTVHFDLDKTCSKVVLQQASGFWQVEQAPGGHPSRTRIWLRATLRASSLLPHWVVDYAAERALRRATSWMKPYTESLWLNKQLNRYRKEDWAGEEDIKVNLPAGLQLLPSMA